MTRPALKTALLAVSVGLVALLTGCTPPVPAHHVTSASPGSARHTPDLQHVVIIMEENKTASAITGNAAAPYLNGLANQFSTASNYRAVSHPSLPNYLALTGGTTAGITSDCNPPGIFCQASVANIADEIVASGRTWKAYAESMPGPCSPHNSGEYAVRHNPFLYYPSVTLDPAYCVVHDVPYSQFAHDLASTSTLPNYSFISPNLCNDMHDCSVATGDGWLAREVPRILNSRAFTEQNSLLIITFDEAETDTPGNSVLCVFAGPAAKRGYTSSTPFSHYSILRTLEDAWGLDPLTRNDASATPMTDMLATSP